MAEVEEQFCGSGVPGGWGLVFDGDAERGLMGGFGRLDGGAAGDTALGLLTGQVEAAAG